MTGKIVLFGFVGFVAAAAAVMLWLAASGVALWSESEAATAPPPPRSQAAPPPAPSAGTATMSSGPSTQASTPAPAPSAHVAPPEFDAAKLSPRCVAVAARDDTDPAILEIDKRTCACMERTLKPADFAMLLDYTEIDRRAADYQPRADALFQRYGMNEPQFMTRLHGIQSQGRACLNAH